MPFDPTKPVENTPLDAAEMRAQLNALNDNTSLKASKPTGVGTLPIVVSDPPTQTEMQWVVDKLNDLITALQV
jgi:hypothetical protein